ncbi:SDR family NAD(P)-dependent oxidoreductase, partial [Escherichia coli]
FVEALAARGANLVLVARRGDRLEDLARSVRARHGVEATPIVADLASPMAAADLRDQVRRAGVRVTGVINNAGFGTFGKFVDDDPGRLAQEIAVDVS